MLFGFSVSVFFVFVCVGSIVIWQLCLVSMCRMLYLMLKLYVMMWYFGVFCMLQLFLRCYFVCFYLNGLVVDMIFVRFMLVRFGNECVSLIVFVLLLEFVRMQLFCVFLLCRMWVSLWVLMLVIVMMFLLCRQLLSVWFMWKFDVSVGRLWMIRLVVWIFVVLMFLVLMLMLLICGQVSVMIWCEQFGLVRIF